MNSESPEQSRGLSAPVKHKSEMILCQRYEHVQENLEEEAKVASFPQVGWAVVTRFHTGLFPPEGSSIT